MPFFFCSLLLVRLANKNLVHFVLHLINFGFGGIINPYPLIPVDDEFKEYQLCSDVSKFAKTILKPIIFISLRLFTAIGIRNTVAIMPMSV